MGLLSTIRTVTSNQIAKNAAQAKKIKLPKGIDLGYSELTQKVADTIKPKTPAYAASPAPASPTISYKSVIGNAVNPNNTRTASLAPKVLSAEDTPSTSSRDAVQKAISPNKAGTASILNKPQVLSAATTSTSSRPKSTSSNTKSSGSTKKSTSSKTATPSEDYAATDAATLAEYDRQVADAQANKEFTQDEYGRSNEKLLSALDAVKANIMRGHQTADIGYENDVKTASDTAAMVERKNRNTLRALGILGSSAAGDILAQPWQQFDQQKASLKQGLTVRHQELDDMLAQKTQEHADMVAELNAKYLQLVNQINRDISYSQQERDAAAQQADLAYQQRLQEIKNAQLNVEMAVDAAKQTAPMVPNASYDPFQREQAGYVPASSATNPYYANYQPQSLGGY